jgi:hypothetical protein
MELYRKALSIAREQEAKLWELRAAASLARLWRDLGGLRVPLPSTPQFQERLSGWPSLFSSPFASLQHQQALVSV